MSKPPISTPHKEILNELKAITEAVTRLHLQEHENGQTLSVLTYLVLFQALCLFIFSIIHR